MMATVGPGCPAQHPGTRRDIGDRRQGGDNGRDREGQGHQTAGQRPERGWNKLLSSIDDTKTGGYAFEGRFLDERQEDLKVGSVLVSQTPVGSAKNGNHWRVGVVGAGGVEWGPPPGLSMTS